MLVLSRRKEEVIRIGDHITVKILRIGDDKVSVGVDAPKEVKVHRQEVYDRVMKHPLPEEGGET